MIKDLNFNTAYDFEVKKETVGGLLFRLDAKASDGNGGLKSATVSDLNKISITTRPKVDNFFTADFRERFVELYMIF